MEITTDYLYQLIGQMVVYKEMLERQVETLKRSLVEKMRELEKLKENDDELEKRTAT